MNIPPLTIAFNPETGQIGFSHGPGNEADRTFLVGLLQKAVLGMMTMPLQKPGIVTAAGPIPDFNGRKR